MDRLEDHPPPKCVRGQEGGEEENESGKNCQLLEEWVQRLSPAIVGTCVHDRGHSMFNCVLILPSTSCDLSPSLLGTAPSAP